MSRQLSLVNGTAVTLTQIVTDQTGVKLLALDSSEPCAIYKSTNGGQSFSLLYTLNDDSVINHIAADQFLENILFSTTNATGGGGGANDRSIFVSNNNGITFNKVTIYNSYVNEQSDTINEFMPRGDYHALAVSSDGGIMCSSATVSNLEKMFFSNNGGSTWYGGNTFTSGDSFNGTKRYDSLTCFDVYIYAGTSGGSIHTYSDPIVGYYSTNAPYVNIPTVFTTVDESEIFISMATNGSLIYALTDDLDPILGNKVFFSNSNGYEFVYYENLPQNPTDPLTNYTKIVCDNTSNIIIMNTDGDLILANISNSSGTLIPATSPDVSISDIAINSNGDTVYAVTPAGLYNLPPLSPSLIEFVKISTLPNINSIVCSSDGTKLYISNNTDIRYSSTSGKALSTYYTIADQYIRFMVGNSDLSYLLVVSEMPGDLGFLNVIYTTLSNEPTSAIIYDIEDTDITASISNNIFTAAISSNPNPGRYIYTILDNSTNQHKYYRSSDFGVSFRPVTLDFIDSDSRIACSLSGDYVFITSKNATNHMVYVSNDYGVSFTSYSNGLPSISVDPYFYLTGISCSSDGQYVFITGRGLINDSCYKSSNYGQTWIPILNVPPIIELNSILSDSTGTHIAIGTASNLYFSDDAGITWQNTPHPTGNVLPTIPFYITPFATSSSGLQQYILYSNGQLYQRKETRLANSDPITKYATQLISSADASTVLCLSSVDISKIYKSVNYGTSFAAMTGITASASGISKMAASSDCSKILYSTRIGTNAEDRKLYLYNGTTSIAQVVKDSGGTAISPLLPVRSMAVNFDCSYKYIIPTSSNLYISTVTNSDFLESSELSFNCSYVACNSSGQYLFITTLDSKIAISSDYGQSFILKDLPTYLPDGSTDPENIIGLYITCNSTGSIVYFTTTGSTTSDGIYKATRNGTSWSEVEQIYSVTDGATIFNDIKCDSTGTYMVATDDIFFSDDGGLTWQMIPNPLPSRIGPVAMNASGSRIFYSFSGTGMFFRNSSGIATPCFLEGTKILCLVGDEETYLSVQNLKEGTLVKTASGFKKVNKIGKSHIQNPGHSGRTMDRLYVCRKENFPELTEDLFITGYHSILVDELTQEQTEKSMEINRRIFEADGKKCLMAALSEKAEPWTQEGTFTIWHLSLEDEDEQTKFGLYSNGLLTETCSMDFMSSSKLENKPVSLIPKNFNKSSL